MKQKTAMKKLLTNLRSIGIMIPQGIEITYLKIEQEQIIEAYKQGTFDDGPCEIEAEQYYFDIYENII